MVSKWDEMGSGNFDAIPGSESTCSVSSKITNVVVVVEDAPCDRVTGTGASKLPHCVFLLITECR